LPGRRAVRSFEGNYGENSWLPSIRLWRTVWAGYYNVSEPIQRYYLDGSCLRE